MNFTLRRLVNVSCLRIESSSSFRGLFLRGAKNLTYSLPASSQGRFPDSRENHKQWVRVLQQQQRSTDFSFPARISTEASCIRSEVVPLMKVRHQQRSYCKIRLKIQNYRLTSLIPHTKKKGTCTTPSAYYSCWVCEFFSFFLRIYIKDRDSKSDKHPSGDQSTAAEEISSSFAATPARELCPRSQKRKNGGSCSRCNNSLITPE